MDIKPKSVKWEVCNFLSDGTFDTVRCIKEKLVAFLSEDINRRGMILSNISSGYKYTTSEGGNIYYAYILKIQKGCSGSCVNGQSNIISLFGKNGKDKKPMIQEGNKIWEFCLEIRSHLLQNTWR